MIETSDNRDNSALKNVDKRYFEEAFVEDGFFVLYFKNEISKSEILRKNVQSDYIQFHFCLKGLCVFNFNEGTYTLNISEGNLKWLKYRCTSIFSIMVHSHRCLPYPCHVKLTPKPSSDNE